MKKTIISFLTLAGLAAAETQYFDFGSMSSSDAIGITSSGASGELSVMNGHYNFETNQTITLSQTVSDKNGWCDPFSGTLPSAFSGSTYVDSLTTQSYSGSTGVFTLKLTGLDNGVYALNVFGGLVGKDNLAEMTITIAGGGDSVEWSNVRSTDGNGDWVNDSYTLNSSAVTISSIDSINANNNPQSYYSGTAKGYQVSATNIEVTNGSLTLTVSGQGWNNGYARTVLNGVALQMVVPEPATATLSLLALAGLASRRRRK